MSVSLAKTFCRPELTLHHLRRFADASVQQLVLAIEKARDLPPHFDVALLLESYHSTSILRTTTSSSDRQRMIVCDSATASRAELERGRAERGTPPELRPFQGQLELRHRQPKMGLSGWDHTDVNRPIDPAPAAYRTRTARPGRGPCPLPVATDGVHLPRPATGNSLACSARNSVVSRQLSGSRLLRRLASAASASAARASSAPRASAMSLRSASP